MKIFTNIPYNIGEINTGKARFHAQFQFDLYSFDQNIVSLFFFHFLHSVHFICRKVSLILDIKRTFV